jgi:signal transduction histidine kinase/DNA-binding response OmpR family regulator
MCAGPAAPDFSLQWADDVAYCQVGKTRSRGSERDRAWVGASQRYAGKRKGAMVAAEMDDTLGARSGASPLIHSIDWSATSLGPMQAWSQTRFPLSLCLGPELVHLYDGACRLLADEDPRALAQRATDCFRETGPAVGPMIEAAHRAAPATTSEDLLLLVDREGFLEETHFEVAPGVGGMLGICAETTQQVYAERQLRTLRALGARAPDARTAEEACASAAATLAQNSWDVPFALLYLFDETGRTARLVSNVGFGGSPTGAAPALIDRAEHDPSTAWPLGAMLRGQTQVYEGIDARLGALPSGHWSTSPRTALALSLESPGQPQAYGVLICGTSPHRALDAGYRGFFELAAAQIGSAILSARADQETRERGAALAEVHRAKAVFFNQVSHEFCTPLTLMLGPLDDALASSERALSGENLDLVHRNAHRLLKLVGALLDFSRLEAGGVHASFEPLDLSAITSELASQFRSTVERGGLRFSVRCERLPEPVFVDREMWEKIVFNLLSNAFEFTFEGEIEVTLRVSGERVQLGVRDTGTGIPQGELPRLFERFHRIEGARSRGQEGAGTGLALVQELVRLHGGELRVESSPGRGSLFTVELRSGSAHLPREPIGSQRTLEAGSGAEAGQKAAERRVSDGPPYPRSSLQAGAQRSEADVRILVVDGDADMRGYIARTLRERWTVMAVADGDAALTAALEWQPDLVLTDVSIPALSGFGLLGELRKDARTRGCSVMMLSARGGDSRLDALEAGASDYLTRPFTARELVARVSTQVQLSRLRKVAEAERSRLFSFLMQLPVAIAACEGPNHVVTLKNPLVDPLTQGRLRLGDTLSDVCSEFQLEGLVAALDRVYSSGEPSVWREQPLSSDRDGAGGEDSLYDIALQPFRDAHGTVTGIVAAASEVIAPLHTRRRKEARRRELAAVMARERADDLGASTLAAQVPIADAPVSETSLEAPVIPGSGDPASSCASDGVTARAVALEGRGPSGSPRRVLVVDDDPDAVALLQEALVELGFSVAVAYDGPSALRVAQSFHPDTALVDVGLPQMDGLELGRLLRDAEAAPGALRLVAITGYGRESDRLRSQRAGFDLHLVKPVALDALSGAVVGGPQRRLANGADDSGRMVNDHGG